MPDVIKYAFFSLEPFPKRFVLFCAYLGWFIWFKFWLISIWQMNLNIWKATLVHLSVLIPHRYWEAQCKHNELLTLQKLQNFLQSQKGDNYLLELPTAQMSMLKLAQVKYYPITSNKVCVLDLVQLEDDLEVILYF